MIQAKTEKYVQIIPPAANANNASQVTQIIDTLGFGYLVALLQLGATDIGLTVLKAAEGDILTTAVGTTASATQTVVSTAGMAIGDTLYYQTTNTTRTILSITNATTVVLNSTITPTNGENVTDMTLISASDYSVSPAVLPGSGDTNHLFAFSMDLLGRKRYIKILATVGNGTTTFLSMAGILSRPEIFPSTLAMRGLTGDLSI